MVQIDPLIVIVLGPQGSGKSTQAKLLAENVGITHFSTGRLLKAIVEDKNHPLHTRVKKDLVAGRLVADDIVNSLLENILSKGLHSKGLVIDGTPRKIEQVRAIDQILKTYRKQVDVVIFIDTSIDESKKRLTRSNLK